MSISDHQYMQAIQFCVSFLIHRKDSLSNAPLRKQLRLSGKMYIIVFTVLLQRLQFPSPAHLLLNTWYNFESHKPWKNNACNKKRVSNQGQAQHEDNSHDLLGFLAFPFSRHLWILWLDYCPQCYQDKSEQADPRP